MSRRRIPQKVLNDIGRERIDRLLALATEAVREDRPERARRYVELAGRIGAKTQVPLPSDVPICRGCGIPLLPGRNCTVRLGNHMVRGGTAPSAWATTWCALHAACAERSAADRT